MNAALLSETLGDLGDLFAQRTLLGQEVLQNPVVVLVVYHVETLFLFCCSGTAQCSDHSGHSRLGTASARVNESMAAASLTVTSSETGRNAGSPVTSTSIAGFIASTSTVPA